MRRVDFNNCSVFLHHISLLYIINLVILLFFLWRFSASSSYFNSMWFLNFFFLIMLINLLRSLFLWLCSGLSLISSYRCSSIRSSFNSITSSDNFGLTLRDYCFMLIRLNRLFVRLLSIALSCISFWLLRVVIIWISTWFISSNFNFSSLIISFKGYNIR